MELCSRLTRRPTTAHFLAHFSRVCVAPAGASFICFIFARQELQSGAVCCSVLQCVAVSCIVWQVCHSFVSYSHDRCCRVLQCVAECCSELHCVAGLSFICFIFARQLYIHSQKLCVHAKEPCANAKESCIHSKEPGVHAAVMRCSVLQHVAVRT